MMTTSQIAYPVLVAGKFGKFGFRQTAAELVERSESLRRLNGVDWLKLIDRDFNLYRMTNLKSVRGAGRFGGYFFEGPFISRRLIYQADLEPLKRLSIEEVAEILLAFMRETQGYRKKDEPLLRQKFAEASSGMKSLDDVRVFFEKLQWGDSATNEDEE